MKASLVLMAALLACTSRGQTPAYTITDLGTLGGTYSHAYGIDNMGNVVGYAYLANDSYAAVLFTTGTNGVVTATNLGDFGFGSVAHAINSSGQITGAVSVNANVFHAAVFQVGSPPVDLDAGDTDSDTSHDLNDAGQLVGVVLRLSNGGGGYYALRFLPDGNGGYQFTAFAGPDANAIAINQAGQVAGYTGVLQSNSPTTPLLWTFNGSQVTGVNLNGGNESGAAYGLNNVGQIVGESAGGATRWTVDGSTVTDQFSIYPTSARAYAINDGGQVVGDRLFSGNVARAFIYSAALGGTIDLNTLVGPSPIATAINFGTVSADEGIGHHINNWGQIAADGTVGGQNHALLLTPTTPVTTTANLGQETWILRGFNYSAVPAFSKTNAGLTTTIMLLDGVVGNGGTNGNGFKREVIENLEANPSSFPIANSYAAIVDGTNPDTYVIQMNYDEGRATTYFGNEANTRLTYYHSGQWINAVEGNNGGAPGFAGNGAYNATRDFRLGTHGIDTVHNTVWAVVNFNGVFAPALNSDLLKKLNSFTRSGTTVTLKMDGYSFHTYQLQRSTTLSGFAPLKNVADIPGSTGNVITFAVTDGATRAFYRIATDPP